MLSLHDSATGQVRPFEPRVPGLVSMYVCGPTVYGPPHLGHGRFSLAFDVLRRYLLWCGFEVRYVSNITDVDDKIIARANEEGVEWPVVAQRCEAIWWEAMDAIGVLRPTQVPHATDYIDGMVEFVGQLIDAGSAYVTGDGVYFRPGTVDDYGLLARQSVDSLQAGARVDVDSAKESPIDFALWKFAKPGEPSWPSPWGAGRPGWHTECVVMARDLLGDEFDLHGGGQDLAFPHHENERAQACAVGAPFAGHWAHNGFVEVAGEKMSKSLGNFTNLLDLLESHDARAYRMLCLQAHYRSPVSVDPATIANAEAALGRLDNLARRTANRFDPHATPDPATLERFRAAMDRDLDTPGAMAVVFTTVTRLNALLDELDATAPADRAGAATGAAGDEGEAAALAAAVGSMLEAVGLDVHSADADVPADVLALAAQRDAARAARDWAAADALRDQLVAQGWLVEDTPSGTQVRPA